MKRKVTATVALILFAAGIHAVPPGTEEDIAKRLTPVGSVCRVGDDCGVTVAAVPTGPLSGEEVYNQFCTACHSTGLSGAPKLGALDEWQPRIDKGMDELMVTTLNGINAMPPKGTCMNCSDDELADAVTYMLDSVR